MTSEAQVLAAGGVVVRQAKKGPRILVVHRPGHEDWSLPKGKLEPGESFLAAACREMAEETGVVPRVGRELSSIEYVDRQGRPKRVRYWRMTVFGEVEWSPDEEVAETAWWSPERASEGLTYDHDRALVDEALAAPDTNRLAVIRHAHAGVRAEWHGDDRLRPLSKRGRRQSRQLTRTFRKHELTRIVTSPLRRCIQTVAPVAQARDLVARTDNRLAEGAFLPDMLLLVASLGDAAAVCSHGDEISQLIGHLKSGTDVFPKKPVWSKGSVWWLILGPDGLPMRARYQPPTS